MAKKLKRNGFIDGTLISYIAIVFTKILGMLYVIPFTALIGETGMIIYSCAYLIYNLVLNASTSGIPTAMSILVAEYNTKQLHKTKMRIYRIGAMISVVVGFLFFVILQIFAKGIANFYLNEMAQGYQNVSVTEIANAIRCIGFCLLIVPFLSIYRGFLQGHKVLAVSAYSQVIEQFSRVAVVLLGAYFAIKVFNLSSSFGVNIALLGAGVGAIFATLYLKIKARNSEDVISTDSYETDVLGRKAILKSFVSLCIPILIVAVSSNIYDIVDNILVVFTLTKLELNDSLIIGSIISTYAPKIAMIISALAMGLTSSIVPEMSELVAKNDYKQANNKLCSAFNMIWAISLPITIGIIVFANPVYSFFYGKNGLEYGGLILMIAVPVNIISCVKVTACMAMQGLKKTKTVCIATISGIVANIILDIPLMYLFYVLGAGQHCYIGALISTAIGQSICVLIIMVSLRKSFNFRYGSLIKPFIKTMYPSLIMGAIVYLLNVISPVPYTRSIVQIIHLGAYAAIGAIVYFVIIYLNGALVEVFGENMINKILRKLRIKK